MRCHSVVPKRGFVWLPRWYGLACFFGGVEGCRFESMGGEDEVRLCRYVLKCAESVELHFGLERLFPNCWVLEL